MRMAIQNEMPGYNEVHQLLNQQGGGLTPAEIRGMLCGGNNDSAWGRLTRDLTNEDLAFGHELSQSLARLHSAISDALEDEGFPFRLFLSAGDNISVFDRVDALAGWVNHFLPGLGMRQWNPDKIKGEAGEAIDDLRNIAWFGYDEDEGQQELEMLLEEIVRYVRVTALLCHGACVRRQFVAPEVRKPTLHSFHCQQEML